MFDPESGFVYFGARYYNPRTAVFVSVDPALVHRLQQLPEKADDNTHIDTFAATFLNLYNYADCRPLTEVDPDGRQSQINLTTAKLREIATAQGIGSGKRDLVQQNRDIGRAFQTTALELFGKAVSGQAMDENTDRFSSGWRSLMRGIFPLGKGTVIPDAVAGEVLTSPGGKEGLPFPRSAFIEVKAVHAASSFWGGGLGLSYSKWQIIGLVDVTSSSPAGRAGMPSMLIFLTTSDTDIASNVPPWASGSNVAVFQAKALAVQDPTGAWNGFGPAKLRNPDINVTNALADKPTVANPLPNGTQFGPLITAPTSRTGADPDPTEVQQ